MSILDKLWNKARSSAASSVLVELPGEETRLLGPPDKKDVANFKQLSPNRQIAVAKQYGRYYNRCIYCGRWLNDPRSKKNGYGLRCAEIRGLPWE